MTKKIITPLKLKILQYLHAWYARDPGIWVKKSLIVNGAISAGYSGNITKQLQSLLSEGWIKCQVDCGEATYIFAPILSPQTEALIHKMGWRYTGIITLDK